MDDVLGDIFKLITRVKTCKILLITTKCWTNHMNIENVSTALFYLMNYSKSFLELNEVFTHHGLNIDFYPCSI